MNDFWENFKEIFYKKKVVGDKIIIRMLCFRKVIPNPNPPLIKPDLENVGKCTYTNPDLYIASPKTKIGAFCSIGYRVVIGHGKHPLNFLSTSPFFYFNEMNYKLPSQVTHDEYWNLEPVEIGNDVWIGDGVFIKNGVKIGDGAVLGARAVVTKDVPPYAIVVGCPAKIIKYRFNEDIIKELLDLKWWELDDSIIKNIPYDNINDAIKYIKDLKNYEK